MNTQVFNLSLSNLQTAFKNIQHESGWSIKDKLSWEYYFLDNDRTKLQSFGQRLRSEGFRIVEIRNSGEDKLFLLRVEEYCVHSALSLLEQCHKLTKLAQENDIEVFDGWDVEKVRVNQSR